MRNEKRNYIVVGAFVIAMLVALILWIALMSGGVGGTDKYFIVYDNVMGLKKGVEILLYHAPDNPILDGVIAVGKDVAEGNDVVEMSAGISFHREESSLQGSAL